MSLLFDVCFSLGVLRCRSQNSSGERRRRRKREKKEELRLLLRKKRKSKREEEEECIYKEKRKKRGEKINNSRKSVHPDGVQQPEVYRPRGARTTKGRPTRDPEECLESGEWLCPGRPSWPPVQKWWRAGLGFSGRECR